MLPLASVRFLHSGGFGSNPHISCACFTSTTGPPSIHEANEDAPPITTARGDEKS